ncbi:MAG: SDR family oxidoreductase [Desulfovibrionaceae bacterium]|nr:SDR family oxidoreductase [Desulfovibrionaceae bacterium]
MTAANSMHTDETRRTFLHHACLIAAGGIATAASTINPAPACAAPNNKKTLSGKTAFVTGAARGIGRAICEKFAAYGADVAMLDIADPAKLHSTAGYSVSTMREFDEAVAAVKVHGTRVAKFQADVRNLSALEEAARQTAGQLGGIDIVVANAGYVAWHSFEDGTPLQWRDVIDVNILGVFYTAKATIPYLKKRGGGRIINLASVGGRAAFAGNGAYTSTKWAVVGMTKQAALELGKYRIAVNAIAPGAVNTPMYRSEGQRRSMGVNTSQEQDMIIDPLSPLGSAGAIDPEDVADAALFLVGDAAKTISATIVDVALGYNASYTA